MKINRAQIITGVVVLAVVATGAYMGRPKPVPVDTALVTRGPLEVTVEADGRTRVRDRYVIVAPVAGRVERITRTEGALVRAGDVVARLRPLPLDSMAVAQAQARIDAANALVMLAATQSRVAAAHLDQRRRELSRAQRLAEVGGVAPRVVEESELACTEALEALRAADDRTRQAEAEARQARAILLGQGEEAASVILVRAPARGRVLRVPERSERIVAAGTPLLELGDPGSLEIVVDVVSSDGMLIHSGDRVRLTEWSSADNGEDASRLDGRVREIEPSGYTKVSALGVEEQRVNIIVDPERVPPLVGDGFRVEASIVVWSTANAITVPRSALLQRTSGQPARIVWTGFVVKDGRVESREVQVGHAGAASAEVLAGIEPGDEIVVFPSDVLKPGIRVKARPSS